MIIDKPEDLTLDNLIKFLRTKPPEQSYNTYCSRTCILAQAIGADLTNNRIAGGVTVSFDEKTFTRVPRELQIVAFGRDQDQLAGMPEHIYTFGKALERALELQGEQ